MAIKAIIFGSIGTIVETSDMQRRAFNQAFEEAGLNWVWEGQAYADMLRKSGGRQRIKDYADRKGETVDATALHARKTEIFDQMMVDGGLVPRDGVMAMLEWAKRHKMKLGFASTTSRANIDAIFNALGGAIHRTSFDYVGDNDAVADPKPAPEIYQKTLIALGVGADDALAIEDTGVSMGAATAAGLTCVGFPNANASHEDFQDAYRIVTHLDPHDLPILQQQKAEPAA